MKKIKHLKRVLGISLMLLSFLIAQIPVDVVAETSNEFFVVDGALLGYHGSGGNVVIPNGITTIGDAFHGENQGNIISIDIPDTVTNFTYMSENAYSQPFADGTAYNIFCLLSNLTNITVANGNLVFDSYDGALYETALNKLIYSPDGKTTLEVKEGTVDIDFDALAGDCKLETVYLPASYTNPIPNSTMLGFGGSYTPFHNLKLSNIIVAEENPSLSSKDGILYDKEQKTLYRCPSGKVGDVVIPDTVETIKKGAFSYVLNVSSITIPKSVVVMEDDENSVEFMKESHSDLVIYCYKDSVAETFAKTYDINYTLLDGETEPTDTSVTVNNTNNEIEKTDLVTVSITGIAQASVLNISVSKNHSVKDYITSSNIVADTKDFECLEMDIELVDSEGNPITEFTSCTITLPLPSEWQAKDGTFWIGAIKADGEFEKLSSNIVDTNGTKCIQFTTNHFSEYAVVLETEKVIDETPTDNPSDTPSDTPTDNPSDVPDETPTDNPNNSPSEEQDNSQSNASNNSSVSGQENVTNSDVSYMPKTGINDLLYMRTALSYGSFFLGLFILLLTYRKKKL